MTSRCPHVHQMVEVMVRYTDVHKWQWESDSAISTLWMMERQSGGRKEYRQIVGETMVQVMQWFFAQCMVWCGGQNPSKEYLFIRHVRRLWLWHNGRAQMPWQWWIARRRGRRYKMIPHQRHLWRQEGEKPACLQVSFRQKILAAWWMSGRKKSLDGRSTM